MYNQSQMTTENTLIVKTLNNVAVEYFELGLKDLSYQIWDKLYHEIQSSAQNGKEFLPVISCNMGNMLRQTGYYEEAYCICSQGLKYCFGTGIINAIPELILQLSVLHLHMGNVMPAESLYSLGTIIFQWIRQEDMPYTINEIMEQDFLLHCE